MMLEIFPPEQFSMFMKQCTPFLCEMEAWNSRLLGLKESMAQLMHFQSFIVRSESSQQIELVSSLSTTFAGYISKALPSQDASVRKDAINMVLQWCKENKFYFHNILEEDNWACWIAEEWRQMNPACTSVDKEIQLHLYEVSRKDLKLFSTTTGYEFKMIDVDLLQKFKNPLLSMLANFYVEIKVDLTAHVRPFNRQNLEAFAWQKLLEARENGFGCIFSTKDGELIEPISTAGIVALSPFGARVGMVYTNPSFRGKKLSQICVSNLCSSVFESKTHTQCIFLFADITNPISNQVYINCGFKFQGSMDSLLFTYQAL